MMSPKCGFLKEQSNVNAYVKTLTVAGIALVSLTAANLATAHAEDTTIPVQKPFGVKIGALFPSSGKVDLGTSTNPKIDNLYNIGLSYDFSKTTATNPVIYGIYADYFSGDKGKDIPGFGHVKATSEIFGIGVSARFFLTSATAEKGQPYAEAGIGYYSDKVKLSDGLTGSKTKGGLGGKVSVGYQLPVGVFGELGYTIINKFKSDGVSFNPSGLNVAVGYRF